MSVINKMLKDLEARKASKQGQDQALHGVDAAIALNDDIDRRGLKLAGVLALVVLLALAIIYIIYLHLQLPGKTVAIPPHPVIAQAKVTTKKSLPTPAKPAVMPAAMPVETSNNLTATSDDDSAQHNNPPVIVKQPASLTATERNGQLYQHALNAFETNQPQMAVNALNQILQASPDDKDARQLLANYYFHSGQLEKAEQVLEIGLAQDPGYAGFTELEAHILLSKGERHQALAMLKQTTVDYNENPDYIAFQAALEEQVGSPQEAVQLYRQILSVRPNNAVWWMGLGLALETAQDNPQAYAAYQRALGLGTLSNSLQEYVRQRSSAVKES